MVLPNWDALPVRTKRSRKRLYALLASELSLTAWKALPNNVKRSKIHLYNYIASAKNLEEYDELAKNNMRSTRLLYTYIKENASGSKPTLTIKVKDGEDNVSGATVTIGSTEKTTDASGETTFSLDYDNYTVLVEKSGYFDYEENIKFRANHKSFTLNIEAEPSQSGTVTVTCKIEENLLEGAEVLLYEGSQYDHPYAYGTTNASGETTLTLYGTQDTSIAFGTYSLVAQYVDAQEAGYVYETNLTVDGDENVIATLTLEE